MSKQTEALKLALEALQYIYEGANNQGPHTGISWRCVSKKAEPAITAIREALADHTEQPLEMVAEQPAQQHIENCIWARNGNAPCPHVQPAQQESEAVRAAWMAGYTEGEREAIEKEQPANVAAVNTSSERVDKTEENVHEKNI